MLCFLRARFYDVICREQGLSQDLDSRVSKMDFGGDRVSW